MAAVNPDKKDWGFIGLNIDELWETTKGEGIKVAILDSGLNYKIEDFKNNSRITWFDAVKGSENKTSCQDDASGHGTDCAAILCAQGIALAGVAPEIVLLVIKITDESGARRPEAVLKGLEKAVTTGVDVISLSFSLPQSDNHFSSIHDKIKEADRKDIAILAAAGDSGALGFPVDNFPASFPECLSIGGIDRKRKRSRYSTRSNFLDLMGPGEDLMSVSKPGKKISGTSFATPFAAGVAALLKSAAKIHGTTLTNSELYDILKRTADKNVTGSYDIKEYGWGILDPVAALNLLNFRISYFK